MNEKTIKGSEKMKIRKTEHFGIQRKMVASITTDSWQNIPHITYIHEPDVSKLFDEYKKLNASRPPEKKVTFNTVILKVISEGLKAAPIMNSHIEYNHKMAKGKITTYENIDVSMPTILPNGEMMTTNLHDIDKKSLDEITAYIKDLSRRAENSNLTEALYSTAYNKTIETIKQGKLIQAAMRIITSKTGKHRIRLLKGNEKKLYYDIPETERLTDRDIEQGTITISNIGSLNKNQKGALAILEIIPPQVTAICVGAIQEKPIVKETDGKKEVAVGKVLPLCLALDHRAMDFGDCVPFLNRIGEIFENPEEIYSWI